MGLPRFTELVKQFGHTQPTLPKVQAPSTVEDEKLPTPAPDTPEPPVTNVQKLVVEKGKVYGHPLDSFADATWGKEVLSKCKDDEVRHALEMIWLKMCRLVRTPDHKDSIDDIAGYAEVIHMIHAERKRRR